MSVRFKAYSFACLMLLVLFPSCFCLRLPMRRWKEKDKVRVMCIIPWQIRWILAGPGMND